MRAQSNAGCCIAVIVAIFLVPLTWVALVLTDSDSEYLAAQFRKGISVEPVRELSIWTLWRMHLIGEPTDRYRRHSAGKELERIVRELEVERREYPAEYWSSLMDTHREQTVETTSES